MFDLNIPPTILEKCSYTWKISERPTLLFTIANDGYADYTINLLKSLNTIKMNVLCMCLDESAYNQIKEYTDCVYLLPNCNELSCFSEIYKEQFKKITYIKLALIHDLGKYCKSNILYTDGDIVFLKNPMNYLESIVSNNSCDCIIQKDDPVDSPTTDNLCTGFFWVRYSDSVLDLFSSKSLSENDYYKYAHDQVYFNNAIKQKLNYYVLQHNLFPNGSYIQSGKTLSDAYILHFNYIYGNIKRYIMKEYGYWYNDSEFYSHPLKVVHVYLPENPFWGLGDFLRGCLTLANICKKYKCTLDIELKYHPISKFLKSANETEHGISSVSIYHIEDLDKLIQDLVTNKMNKESVMYVTTNAWHLADGISQETRSQLRKHLVPTEDLEDLIQSTFSELCLIEKKYTAVHVRMGDKHLMKGEKDPDLYEKVCKAMKAQIPTENPIVLFSDDASLKLYAKRKGFLISPYVPCHLSDSPDAIEDRIKGTLCDFFCISRAAAVYTYSNNRYGSGFVDWCADIFEVPTHALTLEPNVSSAH